MDEKDFELLCTIDETRNITKAADQLYITQSARRSRIGMLVPSFLLSASLIMYSYRKRIIVFAKK